MDGAMVMTSFSTCLVVVALAAPIPRGVQTERPVSPSAGRLLFHKTVRKELKLTIPQVTAIVAEMRSLAESRVKRLAVLKELGTDVGDPLEWVAKEHEKNVTTSTANLASQVLEPEQRTRLCQIDRRLRGPGAFLDVEVQLTLELTEEQRAKLGDAARLYLSEEDRYLSGAVDGDDTKLREELLTLREQTLKELEASLAPGQRDSWNALLGPAVVAFDPTDFQLLRDVLPVSRR
jgi:hypothetical protein